MLVSKRRQWKQSINFYLRKLIFRGSEEKKVILRPKNGARDANAKTKIVNKCIANAL